MLSFSTPTQVVIETTASGFLLFCAAYLFKGVHDSSQTQTGSYILLFFALVFALGSVLGFFKCARKYQTYRKSHPKRRS